MPRPPGHGPWHRFLWRGGTLICVLLVFTRFFTLGSTLPLETAELQSLQELEQRQRRDIIIRLDSNASINPEKLLASIIQLAPYQIEHITHENFRITKTEDTEPQSHSGQLNQEGRSLGRRHGKDQTTEAPKDETTTAATTTTTTTTTEAPKMSEAEKQEQEALIAQLLSGAITEIGADVIAAQAENVIAEAGLGALYSGIENFYKVAKTELVNPKLESLDTIAKKLQLPSPPDKEAASKMGRSMHKDSKGKKSHYKKRKMRNKKLRNPAVDYLDTDKKSLPLISIADDFDEDEYDYDSDYDDFHGEGEDKESDYEEEGAESDYEEEEGDEGEQEEPESDYEDEYVDTPLTGEGEEEEDLYSDYENEEGDDEQEDSDRDYEAEYEDTPLTPEDDKDEQDDSIPSAESADELDTPLTTDISSSSESGYEQAKEKIEDKDDSAVTSVPSNRTSTVNDDTNSKHFSAHQDETETTRPGSISSDAADKEESEANIRNILRKFHHRRAQRKNRVAG